MGEPVSLGPSSVLVGEQKVKMPGKKARREESGEENKRELLMANGRAILEWMSRKVSLRR